MACPGIPSKAVKKVRFGTVRTREYPTRYPNTIFFPISASKISAPDSQPLPSHFIKVVNGVGIPNIPEEHIRLATNSARLEAYRQFLLTQPKPELQHSHFRFCEMVSDKNLKTQTFFSMLNPDAPLLPTYTNTPICSKCGWRHASPNPKKPTRCFTAKTFLDQSLPSANPSRKKGEGPKSAKDSNTSISSTISAIDLKTNTHNNN